MLLMTGLVGRDGPEGSDLVKGGVMFLLGSSELLFEDGYVVDEL